MHGSLLKLRRYTRKFPGCWWSTFRQPVATAGQVFQAILAYFVLVLVLETATPEVRDMLATEWAVWVQALAAAILLWAAVSTLYAPYLAWRQDKLSGIWYGGKGGLRFVYFKPVLVAQERCVGTGEIEPFKIQFTDAEPSSFVYYSVEVDAPHVLPKIYVYVTTAIVVGQMEYGRSCLAAGTKLPADRTATLLVRIPEEFVAITVRVYMREFIIGKMEDRDGERRRPDRAVRPSA